MTVPTHPRCRTVRSWISAAYDDELSFERQGVMDVHLASCDSCRRVRNEISVLGIALRRGAAEQRPDDTAFAGLATEVLARTPCTEDTSWRERVREMVEEGPGLWIMGGVLVTGMAVTILVATVVATPVHPGSLSGVLQTSIALGSNANPTPLATDITWAGPAKDRVADESGLRSNAPHRQRLYAPQLLPRVWADTSHDIGERHDGLSARAAAMLIQPSPPLLLENLTLTAVVPREGQLASVKVLREGNPDAELDRAVSRLVSSLQFVPARVGDAPVAVSVVWLLERTTVRGET